MVYESEVGTDRSEGSGVASKTDEWIDTEAYDRQDHSDGATTFNPKEGGAVHATESPDGRVVIQHRWDWLKRLNDGERATGRDEANERRNFNRDVELVAAQFDMNDSQVQRTKDLLNRARNGRERGLTFGQNKPLEATILAAITLVANEDGWWIRSEPTKDSGQSVFAHVLANFTPKGADMGRDDIREIRRELREYL